MNKELRKLAQLILSNKITTLNGMTGEGASIVTLNIALELLKQNQGVLYYSRDGHCLRPICNLNCIYLKNRKYLRLSKNSYSNENNENCLVKPFPFLSQNSFQKTFKDIETTVEQNRDKLNLKLLILDDFWTLTSLKAKKTGESDLFDYLNNFKNVRKLANKIQLPILIIQKAKGINGSSVFQTRNLYFAKVTREVADNVIIMNRKTVRSQNDTDRTHIKLDIHDDNFIPYDTITLLWNDDCLALEALKQPSIMVY